MNPLFLSSILALGSLGLLFGITLAYAAKKFAVHVDPRVEQITDILPHANCGACGYPGCSAYAEAVVSGKAQPTLCTPGGQEVIENISTIMGISVGQTEEPKVAVVQCQGGLAEAKEKFVYDGIEDCRAAELVEGGHKACKYGCLGLGSCVRACPFDAMYMNDNGLPVVIEDKCTACGICVTTCPRGVMALIPRSQKVFLACVSQDKGKAVKSICKVGCFACKMCALPKVTPSGSIEMEGNLPVIKKIHEDDLFTAFDRCPSKSYVIRGERPKVETKEKEEEKAVADKQETT